jgi:hypothetical protein
MTDSENKRLRERLDAALRVIDERGAIIEEFENDPLLDTNKTLKAEVERLRKALKDCIEGNQ